MLPNPKPILTRGKWDTVVTLLGWVGAADKNVAKYAEIYQGMGYTTIQFTANSKSKGWGTKGCREVSPLAQSLDDVLINPSIRLIFHLFSMNGIFSLTALDAQYPHLKVLEKCDGLFLDSCPIKLTEPSLANIKIHADVMAFVFDKLMEDKNFLESSYYLVCKKYEIARFGCRLFMDNLLVKLGYCKLEDTSSYHYLLNHPYLPPVIYSVFSDIDEVCPADQIAAFNDLASLRKDVKRDIVAIRLKDSAHVEHFRKYPKLYLETMEKFIEKTQQRRNTTSKIWFGVKLSEMTDRMRLIVANGISLQNGILDGSIPVDDVIAELLHMGSMKPAQLMAVNATDVQSIMNDVLTASGQARSRLNQP